MLTDDDLTRQLGSAFRESSTTSRTPDGCPPPAPRPPPSAYPSPRPPPSPPPWPSSGRPPPTPSLVPPPSADGSRASVAPTTTTPDTTGQSPELVTDTIEVAGYTFAYRHAADEPVVDVLHVFAPERVPASARPVDVPAPAKAWVPGA